MKMSGNSKPFHSYLNSEPGRFQVKIPLLSEEPAALENAAYPFSVLSDSDPVSRLLPATILSDKGGCVAKVLLQVQRDRYILKNDELWPIHNPEIDAYWQKAFSFYTGNRESPLILLANQTDDRGRLVPFQPIFFCKAKKVFFPPLCPSCGAPLEQCYDDDLLVRAGLALYSASLKRYLFCPLCTPKDFSHFFIGELDGSDPPILKDGRALIQAFGELRGKRLPGALPCVSCSSAEECYGPRLLALSRIFPFSFYPFYMFMLGAVSLNGSDFLALLSGASFQDLEGHLRRKGQTGRIACLRSLNRRGVVKPSSLFEGDQYFLEVLYLKLSFLEEAIQSFFGGREISDIPDTRISPDRVWVSLEEQNGILPSMWNFRIKIVDLYPSPLDSPPWKSGGEGLFFLGLFWFFTLLSNRDQDIPRIINWLESFSPEWDFSPETLAKESAATLSRPQNIFWNPEGKKVSTGRPLWERSLQLGGELIQSGCKGVTWQRKDFLSRLGALRGEVKTLMFASRPAAAASPPVGAENAAIQAILRGILERWREETEAKETLGETVILPGGEAGQELPEPLPSPPRRQEVVPETVILSGEQEKEKRAAMEDAVPETVIISPGDGQQKFGRVPWASKGGRQDEKRATAKEPEIERAVAVQKHDPEDDLLSETVILGPEKLRELEKKKGR